MNTPKFISYLVIALSISQVAICMEETQSAKNDLFKLLPSDSSNIILENLALQSPPQAFAYLSIQNKDYKKIKKFYAYFIVSILVELLKEVAELDEKWSKEIQNCADDEKLTIYLHKLLIRIIHDFIVQEKIEPLEKKKPELYRKCLLFYRNYIKSCIKKTFGRINSDWVYPLINDRDIFKWEQMTITDAYFAFNQLLSADVVGCYYKYNLNPEILRKLFWAANIHEESTTAYSYKELLAKLNEHRPIPVTYQKQIEIIEQFK